MADTSDFRNGFVMDLDGAMMAIVEFQHVKPGKGPAYVQVKLRGIKGGTAEKRLRAAEEVEQVFLDRREMEYLYSDSSGHVFMDNESYEQSTVPNELVGEQMVYLKPKF